MLVIFTGKIVLASAYAFATLQYLYCMFKHSSYGQKLIDGGVEAREALEAIAAEKFDVLQNSTKIKLQVVLARMDREVKMMPFSGFEISYASLVAVLSVIFTYVIILLQFASA